MGAYRGPDRGRDSLCRADQRRKVAPREDEPTPLVPRFVEPAA